MEIIKLPVSRWQQYKEVRLRALKEDPQAFGASYDDNAKYTEEEWRRRLINAENSDRNWLYFAEENKTLKGMIGAYMEKESKDTATVISVYVPLEERGRGISKLLMQKLLDELSSKQYLKKVALTVNKDQIAAVNLYKKFGFVVKGQQNFKMGNGKDAIEYVMEKTN